MAIAMSVLLLLGGVGVFIAGMQEMSGGIKRSAGTGIRKMFDRISGKPLVEYGVGIGTTAIVQSSSATSIMTIGLANSDIVSVEQGSAIILGAKVGTTLTAFIFALTGIGKGAFSTGIVFASMAFLGVILGMTAKTDRLKHIAQFFMGFGMLFLGLEVMGLAIGGSESTLGNVLVRLFQYDAMKNPILLVLIGTLFTCVIQSSTAAVGIFITLLVTGVLGSIEQSFFLVMGANIGTCTDGIMASLGTNRSGKRIALFHVMTSIAGAVLFTVILVLLRHPIVSMFHRIFAKPQWSLAVFNLSYNLLYTLLLLPFLRPLVALTGRLIREKEIPESRVLRYLDERLLKTPTIALVQIKREVIAMAELAKENLEAAFHALKENDLSKKEEILEREERINRLNEEIADFLIRYSSGTQERADEWTVGATHHVINDIERIGDHAQNFIELADAIVESGEGFSPESIAEIAELYENVMTLLALSVDIFKGSDKRRLSEVSHLEERIDESNKNLAAEHIKRLGVGIGKVEVQYYYDIISELERVADHAVNIAFSIESPTGQQARKGNPATGKPKRKKKK